MRIDWDGPLQFEDGQPCKLFATLNHQGKCKYADGRDSEFADTWAEMHDAGMRRIVVGEDNVRSGYNEDGWPVHCWDTDIRVSNRSKRIMNVPPVSEESMAAMAEHDLWGMF